MFPRSGRRSVLLLLAGFVLCGIFHVLLFGRDFADCFSQLFCGSAAIIWALSVQRRVTDRRLRLLLLWITFFILLLCILQMIRYVLMTDLTGRLYFRIWYAYYIPILAIAVLCFLLAMYIHLPEERSYGRWMAVPVLTGGFLCLGILTNEFHHLAFEVPYELHGDQKAVYGPVYYLSFVFFSTMVLLSFLIILKKARKNIGRRLRWTPVIPVLALLAFLLLMVLKKEPAVGGIKLWNAGETFGFCFLIFLEICIQVGLIPANINYKKLFSYMELPAVILDQKGQLCYKTAGADYPFRESEDVQVLRHPVTGGSIEWTADLRKLRELNRSLAENTRRIEARNAYLVEENQIKREKAELEARNRIYDNINSILAPQLEKIDRLLEKRPLKEVLPKTAVLYAYVKRRSNLELLSAEGRLSSEELVLSLAESLEYVRLCGVDAAVSSAGSGIFPASLVTAAYETAERVIEDYLDTLRVLMLTVRSDKNRLVLRLLLNAGADGREPAYRDQTEEAFRMTASWEKDREDLLLVFTFREGGDGL